MNPGTLMKCQQLPKSNSLKDSAQNGQELNRPIADKPAYER